MLSKINRCILSFILNNRKNKGKSAHSTYNRRMAWEHVVMPLIQDVNRPYFSMEEFQNKKNEMSERLDIPSAKFSYGLVSLIYKGILTKENDTPEKSYSVNYKIIQHLRKRDSIGYGIAIRESSTKFHN